MRFIPFTLLCLLIFVSCKPKPTDPQPGNQPVDTTPAPKDPVTPPDKEVIDIENDQTNRNPLTLNPRPVRLSSGQSFELQVPQGFEIFPAAEGLNRVRFFAKSPDNRIFVTDMNMLADNTKGKVYILEGFDQASGKFKTITTWKDKLRNPNSVQFYTDKNGKDWLYLALTDSLVRFPYRHGELSPSGPSEKLAGFPGYGLSYKYGGWHLSRTIAIHDDKIYVSVGSSCNLCEEKEEEFMRAAILVMNPDGSDLKVFASGVRNAVDIGWVKGNLYATNMAADHLGDDKPNDQFYLVKEGQNYGWPYCFEQDGKLYPEDPKDQSDNKAAGKLVKVQWDRTPVNCADVPASYARFEPHGSPLGFEYFDKQSQPEEVRHYFLAALHGTWSVKKGRGHQIVRFKKGRSPEVVVSGFINGDKRFGRPCDVIQYGADGFLFSDDHAGVVYYVRKTKDQ